MTHMWIMVFMLTGSLVLWVPLWATEPSPSPSETESSSSDKDQAKEPKKSEHPKADVPKRESNPEVTTPPTPPKGGKEGKGEPASPAKGKSETKPESAKEGPKDAGKSVPKKDGVPEKSSKPETEGSPAPPAKSDTTPPKRPLGSNILTVKLAMMAEPSLFPYDIEVAMDGDKAVLSGKVATEEQKQLATTVAKRVDPVNAVVNKLEVAKDLGLSMAKRHDLALVQAVKDRFARSETLKAAGFDVKCDQGVIYLSGTVRFQVFALEAAQAARQVPGVLAVDTSNVQLTGEGKE